MTLRSQRSIYGHCLGHGSGSWMFKAAREICTISYEVNECMKHMLLKGGVQGGYWITNHEERKLPFTVSR